MSLNIFRALDSEEFYQLLLNFGYGLKAYEKNKIIYCQNEICNTLDVILEGQLSVRKMDENGNIMIIALFLPGDILGGNLLFASKNQYPLTVVATENSVVLRISKEAVFELCRVDTDFMKNMLTLVSDKAVVLTEKINAVTLKTIRQRILDFLREEYSYQNSCRIRLSISKKELAEHLGVQRTSLSRELQKMRREGLLEFDAATITIIDDKLLVSQRRS